MATMHPALAQIAREARAQWETDRATKAEAAKPPEPTAAETELQAKLADATAALEQARADLDAAVSEKIEQRRRAELAESDIHTYHGRIEEMSMSLKRAHADVEKANARMDAALRAWAPATVDIEPILAAINAAKPAPNVDVRPTIPLQWTVKVGRRDETGKVRELKITPGE